MLAFLVGRWIGTGLMVKFRPQDMLLVYSLMNILLCGVVMVWGGMVGLYAMLAISFFMSIMYPTQFSLALKGLGDQTKSGSAFSRDGYCRQCMSPSTDGLFHACQ